MPKAHLIDRHAPVLITGGTGLVGRALASEFKEQGYQKVSATGRGECDLRDFSAAQKLFEKHEPEYVFHLAARVYGIGGNSAFKSDILYDNVMINTNVVELARRFGVKKIVAMGSGCVYPELKEVEELTEDLIWNGPPHRSEDSYAHAKRLMLAQLMAAKEQYGMPFAFAISGNLYGPYDNFDMERGHVIPSLVAKFFQAQKNRQGVHVWGSGVAVRDFTYSADVARALICLMNELEGPVNMGSGMRHPIKDIVDCLIKVTKGSVPVDWDSSKPDGQLKRFYKLNKLESCGFRASVPLAEGIRKTFEWYSASWPNIRAG